jgi:hypothetical protein
VLEDVGNADPVIGLIEKSGFHVRDDRDYRGRAVSLNQEGQAVGEDLPADALGPNR